MTHIPGPHNGIFSHAKSLEALIREEVERHKLDLDPSSPRDYIDTFLIEGEVCTQHFCMIQYKPDCKSPLIYVLTLSNSRTVTKNWALMKATWSYAVWICSWLELKPHPRLCSGVLSISSKTLKFKVSTQNTSKHRRRNYK